MSKVEMGVIKPWIAKKITDYIGFEDELVINFAISELEKGGDKGPKPKEI